MLLVFVALAACGQNYNSNTNDAPNIPQGDCSTAAGARLCAAVAVLKSNRCYTCHASDWPYSTDAAWLASGLVVQGQPLSSRMITKLVNVGGNMPFDTGVAISTTDYNTLTNWIQNL